MKVRGSVFDFGCQSQLPPIKDHRVYKRGKIQDQSHKKRKLWGRKSNICIYSGDSTQLRKVSVFGKRQRFR